MDQADLPGWLEIMRAVGLAFGPLLVFGSAVIAAVIAWRAYRQRKEADERAEWWRRTQWAIDYAVDEEEEKAEIGVEALDLLGVSPLASAEDRELLETLFAQVAATRAARSYNGASTSDAEGPRPRWRFPWARRGE
jgi:hypothetical protein